MGFDRLMWMWRREFGGEGRQLGLRPRSEDQKPSSVADNSHNLRRLHWKQKGRKWNLLFLFFFFVVTALGFSFSCVVKVESSKRNHSHFHSPFFYQLLLLGFEFFGFLNFLIFLGFYFYFNFFLYFHLVKIYTKHQTQKSNQGFQNMGLNLIFWVLNLLFCWPCSSYWVLNLLFLLGLDFISIFNFFI